jgi:hypothetical protein
MIKIIFITPFFLIINLCAQWLEPNSLSISDCGKIIKKTAYLLIGSDGKCNP